MEKTEDYYGYALLKDGTWVDLGEQDHKAIQSMLRRNAECSAWLKNRDAIKTGAIYYLGLTSNITDEVPDFGYILLDNGSKVELNEEDHGAIAKMLTRNIERLARLKNGDVVRTSAVYYLGLMSNIKEIPEEPVVEEEMPEIEIEPEPEPKPALKKSFTPKVTTAAKDK